MTEALFSFNVNTHQIWAIPERIGMTIVINLDNRYHKPKYFKKYLVSKHSYHQPGHKCTGNTRHQCQDECPDNVLHHM